MSPAPSIIDLTKLPVKFDVKFDKGDVVLILTTGGIGWLVKEAYRYFSEKEQASIEVQKANISRLIEDAKKQKASELRIVLHPSVPLLMPSGTTIKEVERSASQVEYHFQFSWPKKPRKRTRRA